MEGNCDELTVRTLKIVNHEGKLRITLDGGDEKGPARILMYNSAGHPGLQIFDLPDGRIMMTFHAKMVDGRVRGAHLSECGFGVDDEMGHPAVIVGCIPGSDHYALTVFKDGQEIFEIPLAFDSGDPDDDVSEKPPRDSDGEQAGDGKPDPVSS